MTETGTPRSPPAGHTAPARGQASEIAAAERAYHEATAAHGLDSAEALVAWWHWKEAKRRAFESRVSEAA